MSTRVFFVRHGATSLSAEDRFSGSSDPPLSDEGMQQAAATAKRLQHEALAAVYCSPMRRAMQTAKAVADAHRVQCVPVDELREVDHGRWEGLTQDEVKSKFADEYNRWSDDPFNFAPQRGETGSSVLHRALPVLIKIIHDHANQTIALVSHKATIRLLAARVLGIDPRRYRDRLGQDLACINLISFDGSIDRAKLMLWNDVEHLRDLQKAK